MFVYFKIFLYLFLVCQSSEIFAKISLFQVRHGKDNKKLPGQIKQNTILLQAQSFENCFNCSDSVLQSFWTYIIFSLCLCVCQVVWRNRELCSLQQTYSSLRDGNEGQGECLSPRLLRVPTLQSKVSVWAIEVFPSHACTQADGEVQVVVKGKSHNTLK